MFGLLLVETKKVVIFGTGSAKRKREQKEILKILKIMSNFKVGRRKGKAGRIWREIQGALASLT